VQARTAGGDQHDSSSDVRRGGGEVDAGRNVDVRGGGVEGDAVEAIAGAVVIDAADDQVDIVEFGVPAGGGEGR
jgi:hypothetical protein